MVFWNKLDKVFQRFEKKGFEAANYAHRWTINCILIFCVYTVYSIGSEYNQQFREARVSVFGF
jgi:hypothetical protein